MNPSIMQINEIEILSVGVDVGSSTSHLVFSNLILKRDQRSVTRRFNIEERNVVYEGRIINTPLLDDNTIDIDGLTGFFKKEYKENGQSIFNKALSGDVEALRVFEEFGAGKPSITQTEHY